MRFLALLMVLAALLLFPACRSSAPPAEGEPPPMSASELAQLALLAITALAVEDTWADATEIQRVTFIAALVRELDAGRPLVDAATLAHAEAFAPAPAPDGEVR